MPGIRYSVEETAAGLRRSSEATVIAEGGDDIEVLRNVEAALGARVGPVAFVIANDRKSVLELWARRGEFSQPVAFLADSDLDLFTNVRGQYPGVVFTSGYSIENSCVASAALQEMLRAQPATWTLWQQGLLSLTDWFSAEASFYLSGQEAQLDVGLNMLSDAGNQLTLTHDAQVRVQAAPQPLFTQIQAQVGGEQLDFIRGKQLILLMSAVLKTEGTQFGARQLRSIGAKTANESIHELVHRLQVALAG